MTKNILTVIFFTLLLLVVITGAIYLFLGMNAPEAKASEPAQSIAETEAVDTESTAADPITLNVKQVDIQVESLQDLQNAVDLLESSNILRDRFLFLRCPDCEPDFAIQDCMDLLNDAKQNPEVLYMADSIGLDLNNVHRVNKKHENNGIFCYYYT